tara:strand:+ start:11713 stop:12180 length:468 start_codon:yes stop_codon:yes gene_type:complete
MWKYNNRIIRAGRSWRDVNGNQYPSNWMQLTSDNQKKSVGLTWEDDPKTFDSRFYFNSDKPRALGDLQTQWIYNTKKTANNKLSSTDWYVIRKSEKGTAIPEKISNYRASVRTACTNIENKINGAKDFDEFVALFNAPSDSNGNAPIFDFPDEVN